MKFWEAVREMQLGKKVRRTQWPSSWYVYICSGQLLQESGSLFRPMGPSLERGDWEIYEEPDKLLSFQEVVKGLKEGKKFRRKEWSNKDYFIFCSPAGIASPAHCAAHLHPEDFEANDWVEIK